MGWKGKNYTYIYTIYIIYIIYYNTDIYNIDLHGVIELEDVRGKGTILFYPHKDVLLQTFLISIYFLF